MLWQFTFRRTNKEKLTFPSLLFSLVESFHHKHYRRLNPKLLLTSHIVVYIGCKIQSFLTGVVHLCRAYRVIWDTATALCLFGDRDALSYFLLNLRIIWLNCPGLRTCIKVSKIIKINELTLCYFPCLSVINALIFLRKKFRSSNTCPVHALANKYKKKTFQRLK